MKGSHLKISKSLNYQKLFPQKEKRRKISNYKPIAIESHNRDTFRSINDRG